MIGKIGFSIKKSERIDLREHKHFEQAYILDDSLYSGMKYLIRLEDKKLHVRPIKLNFIWTILLTYLAFVTTVGGLAIVVALNRGEYVGVGIILFMILAGGGLAWFRRKKDMERVSKLISECR